MGSADDIWQLLVNYWPVLLGNALEWYEFAVYGSWTFPEFLVAVWETMHLQKSRNKRSWLQIQIFFNWIPPLWGPPKKTWCELNTHIHANFVFFWTCKPSKSNKNNTLSHCDVWHWVMAICHRYHRWGWVFVASFAHFMFTALLRGRLSIDWLDWSKWTSNKGDPQDPWTPVELREFTPLKTSISPECWW